MMTEEPEPVVQSKIEEITTLLQKDLDLSPPPRPRFVPDTTQHITNKKIDPLKTGANLIKINKDNVTANTLTPREQEKEDEQVIQGLDYLFDNQFMAAKNLFEEKSNVDPLSALALSSMAFLKAVMTSAEQDQTMALDALNATFDIANTQINVAKKSSKISGYFTGYYNYLKRKDSTTDTTPSRPSHGPDQFPANGLLRAHVLKAECCLQIAILQLFQESIMGYVKCGLNLRRAYTSYSYVWQQFQKMGTNHLSFMDSDTISGVKFGIGSVHLVLSALPAKILKAISAFGWKPDRKLGFMLLNECTEMSRVRSPMATIMLLAYYVSAISFAPQIMKDLYQKTAMKILLDAQKQHPESTVYLYFAGRMARHGLDLSLSTQSFLYATELSKNEWAEVAVTNACRFETAINHLLTGNWQSAADAFDYLAQQQYWSTAFCRYAQGACFEMMNKSTEAILLFAQVPQLIVKKLGGRLSDVDAYVLRKVTMFQKFGYQHLDFYQPLLEFMCIWNLFPYMSPDILTEALNRVQSRLATIQRTEKSEQEERLKELAPEGPVPSYFDERASLIVIKSSILNVLGQSEEITLDINWVVDHKEQILQDSWTVPYALWEAGISCWTMNLKHKCRQVWEMALDHGKHDFEHRLAIRLNLVLTYLEDLGYADLSSSDAPPSPIPTAVIQSSS